MVIDSIPDQLVDRNEFSRQLLTSTISNAQFWRRTTLAQEFLSLAIDGRIKTIDNENFARLRAISNRLDAAFDNEDDYRKLLYCTGSEAQTLLDTFQSVK